MAPRASILQLGKLVAKDIALGKLSQGSKDLGDALASQPDAVMEVLDLLVGEVHKKRPNSGLVSAFTFMLQKALEATRWRIENNSSDATELIDKVRTSLAQSAARQEFSADFLLMIAQCFAAAKLDIGDDLRRTIQVLSHQTPANVKSTATICDFEKQLCKVGADLDHDPFQIHAEIAKISSGLSVDQRIEMISVLAFADHPSLREAAPGWLLDSDASIANAMAAFLAQAAGKGLVSGITVSRLINLRNWVNNNQQPSIDAIIRAARHHGGNAAGASPVQINEIIASSCDGAGAQSYFVVIRQKRKISIACLLFKHGFGIRDAWVRHGMTRGEAEAFLDEISFATGGFESTLDTVRNVLAHGLAVNAKTHEPIPFGLLQFIEAIGLPALAPEYLKPEKLLRRLIEEIPADKRTDTNRPKS